MVHDDHDPSLAQQEAMEARDRCPHCHTHCPEITRLRKERDALYKQACRWYTEGGYETLDSPEAVVVRRQAAAREIARLRKERDEARALADTANSEVARLRKERDEKDRKLLIPKGAHDRLRKERDEARALLRDVLPVVGRYYAHDQRIRAFLGRRR